MKHLLRSLLVLPGLLVAVSAFAVDKPVILPVDDPEGADTHRLIWSTEPGVRYKLLQSTDLQNWSTVAGFPSEAIASSMEYSFLIETDRRFFRVLKLLDSAPGGMVLVEGGTLSTSNELDGIAVSTFYIGRYAVTWGEWQEVSAYAAANGYDIDEVGAGCADDHPVHSVNWFDVLKWCNARSEMEELIPVYTVAGEVFKTGEPNHSEISQILLANGYRLPLEAEWEFAVRGGKQTNGYTYSGSNDLNAVGWYWDNSGGAACDMWWSGHGTGPVGQKAANELGLYDMSGNVWEWCWDQHETWSSDRYFRGGSWDSFANFCAVSYRINYTPNARLLDLGFRLARSSVDEHTPIHSLELSGDLSFGEVAVGKTVERTITITNTGNASLNLTGISYPAGFSGDGSGAVAAGASLNVTVTFAPTGEQGYSGTLEVFSNATSGENTIPASGKGVITVPSPEGFSLIPAGTYARGDHRNEPWWMEKSRPVHEVYVSAFCIARTPVTYAQWRKVYEWAVQNGYEFDNSGTCGWGCRDPITGAWGGLPATPANSQHPVVEINWYDMIKWCNAKSEMDGLTPVYYTDDARMAVYKTGRHDVTNDQVRWGATGYRLPTEAEWEKAARGGLHGKRWAWGDENVDSTLANYWSDGTTVVGSYPANGYGLYDMAGNVWQRVWDWFDADWYKKTGAIQPDPRGPPSGRIRGDRGGSWRSIQMPATTLTESYVAYRSGCASAFESGSRGFRLVTTGATVTAMRVVELSGHLSFGSVTSGQTVERTLTITNTGNTSLSVTGISYPAGFSGEWSGIIPGGASQNVTVAFTPMSEQDYSGNLEVFSDATSGDNTILVIGTAADTPVLELWGDLSFGNVGVGHRGERTLTIKNTGNTSLSVTGISYPAGFSGEWSGTVAGGASQNVTVAFTPMSEQDYSGALTVHSDATLAINTIPVSGTGVARFALVEGGTLSTSNQLDGVVVDTFYIGIYEVTWGEWQEVSAFAAANGYDIGGVGAGCASGHPVHSVNWYDVVKWCNAKSELDGLTPVYTVGGSTYKTGQPIHTSVSQNLSANGYRLPLEAEWEFAARGGNHTNGYTYAGSNDLNAVGWYGDNSDGAACNLSSGRGTWPVGQKAANELGLFDMSGNVWEWCWDQWASSRRIRGGSWDDGRAHYCAVSARLSFSPGNRNFNSGFRLARTASQ